MSRKIGLSVLLLTLALSVSGCGVSNGVIDTSGIWGKFVKLVSDIIDYFGNLVGDYGIAILIVTLIIRIIVFPLMYKQLKHSKLMQQLQPEMAKVREKFKSDQKKMNEEMMKLFKEYGTNPLAGCFPVVVQMPVLIALYSAIRYNPHIHTETFLHWAVLGETHNYVLTILTAVTTFLQQKMMMTSNDPQQRMMLYIMPIMIGSFSFTFPAALSLYWAFGNILTIIQLYFLKTGKPNVGGATR